MKKAFFSFYYDEDCWRVQQVRNMGIVTQDQVLQPNKWEEVKRQGDNAIRNWIVNEINLSDIVIVLIGENTYKRKWVLFEINYALSIGKRIIGIYIHSLKDKDGNTSLKGKSPFDFIEHSGKYFVKLFEPNAYNAYNDIKNNLLYI